MLATFFDKELAMGEEVVMVSHRVMMKFLLLLPGSNQLHGIRNIRFTYTNYQLVKEIIFIVCAKTLCRTPLKLN